MKTTYISIGVIVALVAVFFLFRKPKGKAANESKKSDTGKKADPVEPILPKPTPSPTPTPQPKIDAFHFGENYIDTKNFAVRWNNQVVSLAGDIKDKYIQGSATDIAIAIHEELDGISINIDYQPFFALLFADANKTKKVYSEFDRLYGAEDEGDLTQWIFDEIFSRDYVRQLLILKLKKLTNK